MEDDHKVSAVTAPTLRIAVSQFPVSDDVGRNEAFIGRHMRVASARGAAIVHFPETALSGYDASGNDLDWIQIDKSLERIRRLAGRLRVHVVVGVHQRDSLDGNPFNATNVYSDSGDHLGSYSKRNLYKDEEERFTAGSQPLVLQMNRVRCGFLICFDSWFPELFTEYRDTDVELLFLSYHNAGSRSPRNSLDDLMEHQLCTRAADNGIYISASNSSAHYSRMPSGVASPDGVFTRQRRHRPGLLMYDYPAPRLGWTYGDAAGLS